MENDDKIKLESLSLERLKVESELEKFNKTNRLNWFKAIAIGFLLAGFATYFTYNQHVLTAQMNQDIEALRLKNDAEQSANNQVIAEFEQQMKYLETFKDIAEKSLLTRYDYASFFEAISINTEMKSAWSSFKSFTQREMEENLAKRKDISRKLASDEIPDSEGEVSDTAPVQELRERLAVLEEKFGAKDISVAISQVDDAEVPVSKNDVDTTLEVVQSRDVEKKPPRGMSEDDIITYEEQYFQFFEKVGLKSFDPLKLLELGDSHNSSKRGRGLNTYPPQDLWENLKQLAIILDEFEVRLGAPVRILSAYRDKAYNTAVGGSVTSLHSKRCADHTCLA